MTHWSDEALHARGASLFLDDMALPEGTLYAAVLPSPVARGRVVRLDVQAPADWDGVAAVFTARDVPGENCIGNLIADEPLLAVDEVHYVGQPLALVVAADAALARRAAAAIALEIKPLPALFDPRAAYRRGELIAPERTFAIGDVERAWETCDVVVSGRVESGAQEHVYLETQAALACPQEHGGVKIHSATQSPSVVQRIAARVLGCAMHLVEVDVLRLGGGFGGKEDQATGWAVLAALAATRLGRPVKLVLRRDEDMRMTGKRHPYSSDFKLGLRSDGTLLAYEVQFYQNAGAYADLSTAILERTLFHATNSYRIANVRARAASCRTNLPPNTAFRGFGGPQAMFVLEAAIFQAARRLGLEPAEIQRKNLLGEGDVLPYGMAVTNVRARRCWDETEQRYAVAEARERVRQFNAEHALVKKGLALMPVCFGIAFTATLLNQAAALVHIYLDGSVGVSCAAVEMGQGVKRKVQSVAARTLSIAPELVKVESTNTSRIANMSPTAASVNADTNGQATRLACLNILERLRAVAAEVLGCAAEAITLQDGQVYRAGQPSGLAWRELVGLAYQRRIGLSALAHYATPDIAFDRGREQGKPFAYHVFGTAALEVTLDCLRGIYRFETVQAVHDVGQSLDFAVDRGQVEGGVVQGLGWMALEEIRHDGQGRLLTDNLASYKIPDIHFAPDIAVHFLADADNPPGLLHSKAIGEPPFMYGIGGYFALWQAILAFRPDAPLSFDAPWTPEKVLSALYPES